MRQKHDGTVRLCQLKLNQPLSRTGKTNSPAIVVKSVFDQLRGRLKEAIGLQHRIDVFKYLANVPLTVNGVEPYTLAVEDKARYIGECARSNASAFCQVNVITNLALQPFFCVDIHRH